MWHLQRSPHRTLIGHLHVYPMSRVHHRCRPKYDTKGVHVPILIIVLNAVFMTAVVLGIVGHLLYSIATQHRDHGVAATGPFLRRRVWSRRRRAHAGPTRPWVVRRGASWPAA